MGRPPQPEESPPLSETLGMEEACCQSNSVSTTADDDDYADREEGPRAADPRGRRGPPFWAVQALGGGGGHFDSPRLEVGGEGSEQGTLPPSAQPTPATPADRAIDWTKVPADGIVALGTLPEVEPAGDEETSSSSDLELPPPDAFGDEDEFGSGLQPRPPLLPSRHTPIGLASLAKEGAWPGGLPAPQLPAARLSAPVAAVALGESSIADVDVLLPLAEEDDEDADYWEAEEHRQPSLKGLVRCTGSEALLATMDSAPLVGKTVNHSFGQAASSLRTCHGVTGGLGNGGTAHEAPATLQRLQLHSQQSRDLARQRRQQAASVFTFLRKSFADVDVEHTGRITEENLVSFIVGRTHKRCEVPAELENLLQETAARCYRQALVRHGEIRMEDWLHYGLLLMAAPSPVAQHLLNQRLKKVLLAADESMLRQILDAFEGADSSGMGVLRQTDVKEAFLDGEGLADALGLREASSQVGYYEFAAHCLGYRKSTVELNWYDLSHGFAQWVPATVLGGRQLHGIWHTSVVAFGKEYWYGGKVLSSAPGRTPFQPGPTRSTELGATLRTCEEFEDFLRYEMAPRYTRERYDILRHNCNHFTDEVVTFLIQGARLPEEARQQPEAVLSAPLMTAVRPYLNRWLGGFEADGSTDAEIDDLMTEWRARLWPGDFAIFVSPHRQQQEPVRLVRVSRIDVRRGTCDVTFFESEGTSDEDPAIDDSMLRRLGWCMNDTSFWDWRAVERPDVPVAALRPHSLHGRGLAGTVGAGLGFSWLRSTLRTSNPEIHTHLQRKAVVYAHCSQGHAMHHSEGTTGWDLVSKEACCAICGIGLPRSANRMECSLCGYYLCIMCDKKGMFKGFYSLGSLDAGAVDHLVSEPAWVRYKAQRYLAAAGVSKALLDPRLWCLKVAPRVFADLGIELPSKTELVEMYARFHKEDAKDWSGLGIDEFTEMLFGLMMIQVSVVRL